MKKIIALVLFATMLFAFVPAANAAVDNQFTVRILTGDEDAAYAAPWYAQQKSEFNDDGIIGKITDGKGISVSIKDSPATVASNATADKTITIELKGSFNKAEAHWYTSVANNISTNYYGKAVKIPYEVTDSANEVITSQNVVKIDGQVNLSYLTWNDAKFYYLDFPLRADDFSETYWVSYSNNPYRVKIVVKWDNTDNDAAATVDGTYPTLKVVGYDNTQAQYGNYTASFEKQMSYDADAKKDVKGRLVFNVAAYTKADREAIFKAARVAYEASLTAGSILYSQFMDILGDALDLGDFKDVVTFKKFYYTGHQNNTKVYEGTNGYNPTGKTLYVEISVGGTIFVYDPENDTMDIRVKAFAKDGSVYPAGTVIAVADQPYRDGAEYVWDQWLGKSSKYFDLSGQPTYLIDQDGCFEFTSGGVFAFATAAKGTKADDEIYMLYQRQYADFRLIFTSGKKLETVTFDIYYRNVERSKSGITVVGSNELTIALDSGEISLPYVLSDAYAMTKELKTGWQSVNKNIVKVTDEENGKIKPVAIGTTYVYATDAKGDIHLFVVNVVAKIETTPVIEVPAYKSYTVTASKLNVRSGPGTNYKSLGTVARGTVIQGIEIAGSSWIQVNYGGVEAYCSGKYLAEN